jgi:penicillin amidase
MYITLRSLRHFLTISALIGCLLMITAGLLLYGSLPQYDGETISAELSAPVSIDRDMLGSVTLKGQSRRDLALALGFVHAQERFFEMDLMRRQAAGELAELFGMNVLTHDRRVRPFRMRTRATAVLNQLPADQLELLDAYRTGVNQGLQALTVRPFPYLLTQTHPVAWKNEDSILVIYSMFFTLNEFNIYRELKLSSMHAALPDSVYRFLTTQAGKWDAPLVEESVVFPQLPTAAAINLQILDEQLFKDDHLNTEYMPGSNSFAVAGTLTNGSALVANDMHLTLRVPNLWFRTRLIYPSAMSSESHDITGISLPGVPSIVIGSNRHIAWSFTNSYGDFADWVRVKTDENDTTRYLSSTGWEPIRTLQETIQVRHASDEILEIIETEWGPILAHDHDKTPLSLVWTALKPEAINLNLIELEHAQTAQQAARIAQRSGIPVQNFIVGDREGNISWTLAGRIPTRTDNYDPQRPANWAQIDTGWNGWIDPEHYPLIHNPESHRLWSANSRTVSGNQLSLLGNGGYDLGARATQIRDGLFARTQFTAADMQSIQLDHRALLMTPWYELLKTTLELSASNAPWAFAMKNALNDWDAQASTDSIAYRAVRSYRYEVMKTVLNGFAAQVREFDSNFKLPRLSQAELIVWQLIEHQPQHLLPAKYQNWEELLLSCAQAIATQLQKNGGIAERNWGEYNAAQIRHPLSQKLPAWLAHWLDMPRDPLPGDHNMPRVQSPDFGASQRSIVAPGKEEQGYLDMPGGQSGHPLSPYYGSGHANWVSGKPTPFLPGATEKQMKLVPMN